jgi:glutamate dehydrogenase (NAD(P)+)
MMLKAFAEVRQVVKENRVSWRDAAMMIGVGRVAEAHKLRGLYP